jgi:exosome complex exonuclease DIS3/RRP44
MYEDHRPMSEISAGLKAGRYHQGTLRTSRYDPYEGHVGSDAVGRDIVISGRVAMNRAFDGDVVAVELLPNSVESDLGSKIDATDQGAHVAETLNEQGEEGCLTGLIFGKVVGIIKRAWRVRGYCGSLKPPDVNNAEHPSTCYSDDRATSVIFMPVDKRYPMIRIQTRQAKTLSDKRFVVVVDGWDVDSAYPQGHYVKTIGDIGDRDVETEVLLIEHDVNTAPFSPAVYDCLPPLPWTLSDADLQGRLDLRHLVICSVDPPGCKDIDDALHVRRLPDSGRLELGVHIADVTHFVLPGTPLDGEAAVRATTTYLVQRRIDMLPKALTEDICSLRAGVDRLAFSVLWEVTDAGDVVALPRFAKTVIRSRAALTYAEAQTRIDDDRVHDEVTEGLRMMNALAKVFRQRRIKAGALQLASPEVKFEIDTETHDPLDVGMYMVRETNQMVEEMMLLANCTVAEKCLTGFPGCSLLRRHPTPPTRQFEPLLRAAAAVGIDINPETSKTLAESLDRAVRADDPYFNKLIRIAATRCMTQAVYFSSGEVAAPEYHHYGLAAPLYTHFTSPIRRYADVIVHRVLMATLGLVQLPDVLRDTDIMHGVVDNLNARHRNAQLAGRASVELHTLIFFKEREVIADARITKIKSSKTLFVFVPKYGIEGPVHFDDESSSVLIFDEEKQTVRTNNNDGGRVLYTVFDQCAVRISVKEGYGKRRWLSLEFVDRGLLPVSEKCCFYS